MLTIGLAIGFGLFALYDAVKCFYRVEEGTLAVVTSYGKPERDEKHALRTHGPGLHMKLPWAHVHRLPTQEVTVPLTSQGVDEESSTLTAMTADGTVLRCEASLRYRLAKGQAEVQLFGLRDGPAHLQALLTALLKTEIACFGADLEATANEGSYALLRRERSTISKTIDQRIGSDKGRYGVEWLSIDLLDVLPPDELAEALNAVIDARIDAETAYARAEADCAQRVLSAERGIAIARGRAQAIAKEIVVLAESLAKLKADGVLERYVQRRKAETYSESRTFFVKNNTYAKSSSTP